MSVLGILSPNTFFVVFFTSCARVYVFFSALSDETFQKRSSPPCLSCYWEDQLIEVNVNLENMGKAA